MSSPGPARAAGAVPSGSLAVAVRHYDLAATLDSGQAFRWEARDGAWEGVVGRRWLRARQTESGLALETPEPVQDWDWALRYFQTSTDLEAVVAAFPQDEPLRAAVAACHGLRLLRQDSWECLASFILSSTKQIVQIRQIVGMLCQRFGERIVAPPDRPPVFSFPSAERLAECGESELRDCKMGFRAPYLLGSARVVADGQIDLRRLESLPLVEAREELMRLPGVGRKIADCALLFGFGFQEAFPVDVWVLKALQRLYFPKRRADPKRIKRFVESYFGPRAGYAQQYLFHYMRTKVD